MPRSLSRTTGRRRPVCLSALLTAAALTVAACGGEDAPTVVTVTAAATDGARPQSTTPVTGPVPTGANGEPLTGGAGTVSGKITLTGTVVDMTTSEIMAGRPSPNGDPESNGYIVLQLDSPRQVTAQKAGAPGKPETKTVSQISLSTPSFSLNSVDWTGYVGQHVTVTTGVGGMRFPSDTGLPLGMVRLSDGTVQ